MTENTSGKVGTAKSKNGTGDDRYVSPEKLNTARPTKFYLRAWVAYNRQGRGDGEGTQCVAGLCLYEADKIAEGTSIPRHKKRGECYARLILIIE